MKNNLMTRTLAPFLVCSLVTTFAFAQAEPTSDEASPVPRLAGDAPNEEASSEATPPTSKMNLRVAEPGPPLQRTDYVHEGFYARVAVGPGYQYTNINNKLTDSSAASNSFSLAADLKIGGSPSAGMALGGGILTNLALGTTFDDVSGGAAFNFLVGPFFDAFPDAKEGFHMGTLLGMSGISLSSDVSPSSFAVGGGGAAWIGYDMWVAPEWSTGFDLRVGGSYLAGADVGVSVFHAHFLITVLSH